MRLQLLTVTAISIIFGFSNQLGATGTDKVKEKPAKRNRAVQKKATHSKIMNYLRTNYPEQVKAIRKQMKSNPEVAKAKMKALAEKGLAKMKAERQEFINLIKKYQESQNESVLTEIRQKITEKYDKRIAYAEKTVARSEKALEAGKLRLEKLKADRDKNINKYIEKIKRMRKNKK